MNPVLNFKSWLKITESTSLFENFDENIAVDLQKDLAEYLEKEGFSVEITEPTTEDVIGNILREPISIFSAMGSQKNAVIWIRESMASAPDGTSHSAGTKGIDFIVDVLISNRDLEEFKNVSSPSVNNGLLSLVGPTNIQINRRFALNSGEEVIFINILGKSELEYRAVKRDSIGGDKTIASHSTEFRGDSSGDSLTQQGTEIDGR